MTTNVTSTTSTISNVDPLYGPGTILGWYFTLAACFVSWTLHPKKRKQDSVDPDLVVSLILPIVAVIHLVSQVSQLSTPQTNIERSSRHDASDISQNTADAIEAPLVIIEAFMNIATIMFIVACSFVTVRRALLVGAVGVVSFAADCHLHMSKVRSTGLSRFFSRSFVADSAIALIMIGVILALLILFAFMITSVFFYNRHKEQNRRMRAAEAEIRNLENGLQPSTRSLLRELQILEGSKRQEFGESIGAKAISLSSFIFLPLSSFVLVLSTILESKRSTETPQPTPAVQIVVNPRAPGFIALLFPRSNSSFNDLDQKVAVFAGSTALAFSLYSVFSLWYTDWGRDQVRNLQRRQEDNLRLRRLILEGQSGSSVCESDLAQT